MLKISLSVIDFDFKLFISIYLIKNNNKNMKSALTEIVEKSLLKKEEDEQELVDEKEKRPFNFCMEVNPEEEPLKIQTKITNEMSIGDGLKQALKIFAKILKERNLILKTELENFTPRLSKKNGRPKTDMPSFDLRQKFSQIKVNTISVQIKDKETIFESPQMKTPSHDTINTQMGVQLKKKEIMDEEETARKEKNENCFFSFC